jgi:hypothetical protein
MENERDKPFDAADFMNVVVLLCVAVMVAIGVGSCAAIVFTLEKVAS